jgi:hypothetical protein
MTEVLSAPMATPPSVPAFGPPTNPTPSLRGPSWPARSLVALFKTYQILRMGRVSPCRFTPTCSHYAIEAVDSHGARRGLALAVHRLGRCRPGGPSGFDPVPE